MENGLDIFELDFKDDKIRVQRHFCIKSDYLQGYIFR